MIFSSYSFLFIFLPICFLGYVFLNKKKVVVLAKWWLVLSSFVFYSYGHGSHLGLFIFCVTYNYFIGIKLGRLCEEEKSSGISNKFKRRIWLFLGVVIDLALLGYFKYYNFAIENINYISNSKFDFIKVALPLGISFYTFQKIAYLVDSYRGTTKDFTFLNYMMFISFFPQLIVGPIVHHHEMLPQFNSLKTTRINYKNIAKALFLLSIGFSKKLLIADPLTDYAQKAFGNAMDLSTLEAWAAALSYTVSFYFDLSGYGDMAVALGLLFNFKLPINFNSPYKARNFADYWRRWHMSLSRFLGNYIFRNVYKKGDGSFKFYLATMITFLVSGIWHGAGWTFIAWGILNGIFVAMSHSMKRNDKELPFFLAWSLTFFGVIITRILFVSKNFTEAWYVTKTLFDIDKIKMYDTLYLDKVQIVYILVGLGISLFLPNSMEILEKFKPNKKYLVVTVVLLIFSILQMGKVKSFLYFQF